MRKELDPKIELQDILHKQIYDALQGDTLQKIRRICEGKGSDIYYRSEFEGNSLKIEKTLLPDIYDLCQEVLQTLEFNEPVDFYITGDSEVNAMTIASDIEGKPHIVNIQSALFQLMNRDELKFVIGHEIGHLINGDCSLRSLIYFMYPNKDKKESKIPGYLENRLNLYDQISELGADRWGYMACENLDASIRAFYKMGSGLDLSDMNISMETLVAENKKRLDFFLNENGVSLSDHPVNTIRIQAIYLFATAKTQRALREGMGELIDVIWNVDSLDRELAFFYATAGLIVASSDGQIVLDEKAKIIERLGEYEILPQQLLRKIEKSNVTELFNECVKHILEMAPYMKAKLLNYFIEITCADGKIAPEELELVIDFGKRLGFHPVEISRALAIEIRDNYVPKVL